MNLEITFIAQNKGSECKQLYFCVLSKFIVLLSYNELLLYMIL